MALLHQSVFTAANGTNVTSVGDKATITPTGAILFTAAGTVLIQDNRAYAPAGIIYTLNDFPYSTANYVVRCVFRRVSGAPSNVLIYGRDLDTDAGDCYRVTINGTTVTLDVITANTPTSLGSATISSADGVDYTVELVMNGSAISVRWGGSTIIGPVTNTANAGAGYVFVRPQNSTSTTGWHLDTLEIDDNVSSGGSTIIAISSGSHQRMMR